MKNYGSEIEHESRKSIFRQARRYINSKNRENLGFTLAINHLSDLNEKELKLRNGYRYTGIGESHRLKSSDVLMGWNIPDSMNWTAKGAVNPPKDQGICGSCWSFGTTGTLEGSYFLKYGEFIATIYFSIYFKTSARFACLRCAAGGHFVSTGGALWAPVITID